MKLVNLILLASLLVVAERPSRAAEFPMSGNEFLRTCSGASTGASVPQNKPDAIFDTGLCYGYVQGFMEGAATSDKQYICIPDGVNIVQLLKVVINYMNGNPERLHDAAMGFVFAALLKAYPCGVGRD